MSTTDTLVEALLRKPRSKLRDQLVQRALAGTYHDWKSTHAVPKLLLLADLERCGYRDLALRTRMGDFEDKADEADNAQFAKELADDPEWAALWEKMQACKTLDEVIALVSTRLTPGDLELALAELGWGPVPR